LSTSMVCSSSRHLRLSSRISRADSVDTPAVDQHRPALGGPNGAASAASSPTASKSR
jgi:hypothetical protein